MRLADAKIILTDVLNYQIADSLVKVYEAKNDKQNEIITVQKEVIDNLQLKIENKDKQLNVLGEIIKNKDKEIVLLNDVVKKQKKEIIKQKLLKLGGFSGAIILPVITALILLK
jgi:regulatory protein YycH of two-component signal transduction system YycFG